MEGLNVKIGIMERKTKAAQEKVYSDNIEYQRRITEINSHKKQDESRALLES